MKGKRKQRILRPFLAAALVLILLPLSKTTAKAAPTSGDCGKISGQVRWVYDDTYKKLTISGNGEMADYVLNDHSIGWDDWKPYMETVVIENGVKSIGNYAFFDCENLTSVSISDSVENIGASAFSFCPKLASVKIPDGVTNIGDEAFSRCTGLTSVKIGNRVTSIGNKAFNNCQRLASVEIPDGVTNIGDEAFSWCTGLTSVKIGNHVTSIGDEAFASCKSLKSVTIPDSVTSIGALAFEYCTSLTSVKIGNSVEDLTWGLFQGCTSLTSVTIPPSVTGIDWYVFSGCTSLTSVTIPPSVTGIGMAAFADCTSLTSVMIPSGVTSISSGAFSGCTSLTSVTIPPSVTGIGTAAFEDCTSLTSITIPGSVTIIGNYAFGYYWDGSEEKRDSNFTTIYGTAGSVAESYALANEIKFVSNLSTATVTVADQTYTGSALTPEPKVKVGSATLTKDKDYSVSYSNNINVGTATVTITGKDKFFGTKSTTFKIQSAAISSATITLPNQTYTYNGSAFTPEPTVKIGDSTLTKDKDYTVSYSNNTNAGTATVTITGKGNYNGTKETTFVINPAPNSDAKEPDAKDPTKPGTSVENAEKYITGLTNDNDPAGTDYQTLQAKASKVTKSSVKLSWKRVSGAKGYIIYGNKCGKKNKYKKIKTVTKTSYTQKKLKKGTYYKYLIVAYDKDNKVLTTSKTIHAATTGGKYSNAKSVTTKAKKDKVTIKVKKSFNLKAKAVASSKKGKMEKHRAIQYESTDTNIATVSAKGVITGKAKGTCYVYVYAMNGVSKKIKVTVK